MAGKKINSKQEINSGNEGEKKGRTLADYVFEEHKADGTVTSLGLTLHYPSEAKTVQEYLESKREELAIEGVIRICKKIYS